MFILEPIILHHFHQNQLIEYKIKTCATELIIITFIPAINISFIHYINILGHQAQLEMFQQFHCYLEAAGQME